MDTIDVEVQEAQPASRSPYRVAASAGDEASPRRAHETDPAMIFATVTLLAASLLRLSAPLAGREAFGAEPTLALCVTAVCVWLALREGAIHLRERWASRRSEAVARSRNFD